jgi:NADH-quinone oxidoreductase subunit K
MQIVHLCIIGGFKLKKIYMWINLIDYLVLNTVIFLIGVLGLVLNRKNILIILMSIELMLLAINMNFVVFSVHLDDLLGQVFALFVLTVAAAESAIGLAILVVYYRVRGTIAIEKIQIMRG